MMRGVKFALIPALCVSGLIGWGVHSALALNGNPSCVRSAQDALTCTAPGTSDGNGVLMDLFSNSSSPSQFLPARGVVDGGGCPSAYLAAGDGEVCFGPGGGTYTFTGLDTSLTWSIEAGSLIDSAYGSGWSDASGPDYLAHPYDLSGSYAASVGVPTVDPGAYAHATVSAFQSNATALFVIGGILAGVGGCVGLMRHLGKL